MALFPKGFVEAAVALGGTVSTLAEAKREMARALGLSEALLGAPGDSTTVQFSPALPVGDGTCALESTQASSRNISCRGTAIFARANGQKLRFFTGGIFAFNSSETWDIKCPAAARAAGRRCYARRATPRTAPRCTCAPSTETRGEEARTSARILCLVRAGGRE